MTSGIRLKLRETGMKHLPVTAAGDCFYLGASIVIHGKPNKYQEIRRAGAEYLGNNMNEFAGMVVNVSTRAVVRAYGRPVEVPQQSPDGQCILSQFSRPLGENAILLLYNGIGEDVQRKGIEMRTALLNTYGIAAKKSQGEAEQGGSSPALGNASAPMLKHQELDPRKGVSADHPDAGDKNHISI
jgi:hypothetical protein